MSPAIKSTLYFIPVFIAFLLTQSSFFIPFLVQIIALTAIIFILSLIFFHRFSIVLIIFLTNLIILSTGAISSPLFFLIYFLLFALSFQNHPLTNLSYSLITIIFFSYSLSSPTTIIQLLSLILITPLTWFISYSQDLSQKNESNLSQDETDFLLWISLHLKSSLREIIFLSDNSKITKIAKNLIKDSEKLGRNIDQNSDET